MHQRVLAIWITTAALLRSLGAAVSNDTRERLGGERGEGVISAAIAVLIMAFLGVAMWIGFRSIWESAESETQNQISQIGS